jgi:RNA polymerase sigma-70 factor (ECF subfamily)
MAEDPLGELFDRYRREGELAALERVFDVVAPELLALARHLRPRGQAPEDLVQSTFLAALTHRASYDLRRPLRPWLLGILLNKASSGRRRELGLEGEVELPDRHEPRDAAEAAESARLLARGLERLPPIYSEVLREHFIAGLQPGEIAARLGRPPGTVRAQLHRGLRLLRGLLPMGLAGWLAWLGPSRASLLRMRRAVLDPAATGVAPERARPGAAPLAGARLAGTGVVALAAWLGLRSGPDEPPRTVVPPVAQAERVGEAALAAAAPATGARDAVVAAEPEPTAALPVHGELLVRVRYADGSPAEGIGLRVYAWGTPPGGQHRLGGVTDSEGELVLERVHAGRVGLYCDRGGDAGFGVTVAAGQRAVSEFELPVGVQVEGQVVDERGAAVAGAGVWLSESPLPRDGRIAAVCDTLGRFRLRDVSPSRYLAARAEGYAPSQVEWLASGGVAKGLVVTLRLVLPDAGGSLAGTVLDPFGAPVPGARVAVRSSTARHGRLRGDGILLGPAATLEAETDARGRFAIGDLALEEFDLAVHAPGAPEHVALARLSPEQPHADVELRLPAAGSVRGTLRFEDGEPAAGALVRATHGTREPLHAVVDEDGAFALESVAPGPIELEASFGHTDTGPKPRASLWLEPGGEQRWDARIERRGEYSGRVLGPRGEPLAGAWVRAESASGTHLALPESGDDLAAWLFGWTDRQLRRHLDQVATDAQGRFTLRGVARDFALEVRLPDGRGGWPVLVLEPAPSDGELALPSGAQPAGVLSGTIAAADGRPLERGEVYAVRTSGGDPRRRLDADGAFRFDSLPPGTFDLLVWSRGHRPQVVARVALREAEQLECGTLSLAP